MEVSAGGGEGENGVNGGKGVKDLEEEFGCEVCEEHCGRFCLW